MNKFKSIWVALCVIALTQSCGTQGTQNEIAMNRLTAEEIAAGKFTPEIMLKMSRLSGSKVSPDGTNVLYSVSEQDVENNGSYSNLFVTNIETGVTTQLTSGKFKHNNHFWSADGKVMFLSSRDGNLQIWSVDADGQNLKRLGNLTEELSAFGLSPKGDKVWFTKQVKVDKTKEDYYPQMSKSKAKIYDDLMVRHWDYWLDGTYSHLFVADFDGENISSPVDITEGGSWDVPLAPYFDDSEIVWSPDGESIAYVAKKLSGKDYALSTNSDIYIYDINSKATRNLTEGMPGYDRSPVFSPSGKRMAFTSMERPGNESDKERLMVADIDSGEINYVTSNFDFNAGNINWVGENELYFISPMKATYQICRADAKGDAEVSVLTNGLHDYVSLCIANNSLVAEKTTLSSASDIFVITPDLKEKQLTAVNKDIYDNVKMGEVMERWITTTDGKQMLTWVVLPPDFDSTKKYPTLLYCQGGPQSVVSQRWSYRWNLQIMASEGYVVVAPNRRGLPSFGQEWLDQISGDYSGQNIKDYLSAIDDVSLESWVDTSRRGCVGASYGGYSTYYLAGNHEGRFKTFISHCGMFNFDSFYGSTEELWFPNNDLGGSYWSENPTAKRSFQNSPHKFVQNWDSPILIIVGAKDYRIPYTESLQAHTAARLRGLDSRLVVFEDEGHQVFKPQNSLVWHSEFLGWLNKYLK